MNERDEELARSIDPDAWRQLHEDDLDWCERFAELVRADEREKVAAWMMQRGYATGHGDTVEDLLKEIEGQVAEREREACAKVCDRFQARDVGTQPAECAAAIRARGNT